VARIGPLDDAAAACLLDDCEQHRLLGLLAAAVRDGALLLTDSQRQRLERLLQAWLAHALRVEGLLLEAGAALDRAGIAFRVLKGVALGHLVYPDPSWRVFGDLDLLVPGDRLSAAVHVLQDALGARRPEPELRPGFDDRFGKEAMLDTPDGLELDLHRTFVDGALGLSIDLDDLFAGGTPFTVGGREVEALSAGALVLHAAYAVVVADWPPRLASVRDLVQAVVVVDPPPSEVIATARRWGARALLARALTAAWAELDPPGGPALVDWAEAYRPTRREQLVLAAHVGPQRATTRHLAATLVLPGWGDRAAYLRAVAWPQRSYLEARGFGRAGHAQRALARLNLGRRRPSP
jgi:hypothetical protein